MFVFFPLFRDVKWFMVPPSKIITSRPKQARRGSNRRGVGRTEAPGKKEPSPSACVDIPRPPLEPANPLPRQLRLRRRLSCPTYLLT